MGNAGYLKNIIVFFVSVAVIREELVLEADEKQIRQVKDKNIPIPKFGYLDEGGF